MISASVRSGVFEALRVVGAWLGHSPVYRDRIRWPVIRRMMGTTGVHRVVLEQGIVLEVSALSRIEQSLLLRSRRLPDHVWEPQTTRLLQALARGTRDVIVGGAYVGDQVLLIGRALEPAGGRVHAFEPMPEIFRRLCRNLELNALANVVARRQALWDRTGDRLSMSGSPALARCVPDEAAALEAVVSVAIDDYAEAERLDSIGLIMLDLEGAEERALLGARSVLARPPALAPHLVFEVHRDHVDWSDGLEGTGPVALVMSLGYRVFAIRDYHDNVAMHGRPIEVIPVGSVHLDGPPHGFNLLATKDDDLVRRFDLRVVAGVSPKLLRTGDPRLHQPLS
jgi:FkbM family methyltransferase